jgi:hypothetical protein
MTNQYRPEFNFPGPISNEQDFYGREIEWQQIKNSYLDAFPLPVIICGERRIGKTSLLNIAAYRLRKYSENHIIPLVLPPAGAIHSLNDFVAGVLKELCSYLGKSLQDTCLLDSDGQVHLTATGQFKDAVQAIVPQNSYHTFLICIDELDSMMKNAGPEANKVLALVDYIIRADLPLTVCITLSRLPEAFSLSTEPLEISKATIVNLGPFSFEETVEIVEGLLGNDISLTPEAMRSLYRQTGGHPYFVKLILNYAIRRYWTAELQSITVEMLHSNLLDAVSDIQVNNVVKNIYDIHFSPEEQVIALLLARQQSPVLPATLQTMGPAYKAAAHSLVQRGYLTLTPDDNIDWQIAFLGALIRDWEDYEIEVERLDEFREPLTR